MVSRHLCGLPNRTKNHFPFLPHKVIGIYTLLKQEVDHLNLCVTISQDIFGLNQPARLIYNFKGKKNQQPYHAEWEQPEL